VKSPGKTCWFKDGVFSNLAFKQTGGAGGFEGPTKEKEMGEEDFFGKKPKIYFVVFLTRGKYKPRGNIQPKRRKNSPG